MIWVESLCEWWLPARGVLRLAPEKTSGGDNGRSRSSLTSSFSVPGDGTRAIERPGGEAILRNAMTDVAASIIERVGGVWRAKRSARCSKCEKCFSFLLVFLLHCSEARLLLLPAFLLAPVDDLRRLMANKNGA